MADFIPTPNCAVLTLGYTDQAGRPFSNGLAFEAAAPWTIETLTTLNETASDAWVEALQSTMSINLKLVSLKSTSQESASAPSVVLDITTGHAGTRSGFSLPLNTAMSVTLRTDNRGRSFRGRVYHTGLVYSDQTSPTVWTAEAAAVVGTSYGVFANAIETATASEQVVISRQQDGSHLLIGDPTVVVARVGRRPIATVRGRVRP